jgi:hypothetical protein
MSRRGYVEYSLHQIVQNLKTSRLENIKTLSLAFSQNNQVIQRSSHRTSAAGNDPAVAEGHGGGVKTGFS